MITIQNKCSLCADKSCAVSVLTPEELELLSGNCAGVALKKGETLSREGALPSNIIYLRSGLVKESIIGINGKEQIVQIIKPLFYIGVSTMLGAKVSHFNYKVLTDAQVCYIDASIFKKLVKQNGHFAFEIMTALCRENLGNYHRFVENNQKQLYGRLAHSLLSFREDIFDSVEFDLPVTHSDLAALISTTRESVTRGLSKFCKEGIIGIEKNHVKILDETRLHDISRNG
ncbi:MAG: Crp/Fnr family transcriptional regulator [Lentimicrobiaceae bacterium]|nr:Crp/Fnr family transcriptional regulator [Lentimicrobiaceae bacterium]MCO5266504.1 Crp/Fnr family transcriptional regulator [Lentimicrobium sp.]